MTKIKVTLEFETTKKFEKESNAWRLFFATTTKKDSIVVKNVEGRMHMQLNLLKGNIEEVKE